MVLVRRPLAPLLGLLIASCGGDLDAPGVSGAGGAGARTGAGGGAGALSSGGAGGASGGAGGAGGGAGGAGGSPLPASPSACAITEPFEHFITRSGDRLMDGDQELRFVSFNSPGLMMIEEPGWRLPDPWEQEDALCSIARLGGQVVRTYVLSVGDSGVDTPRHVVAPGEFSEEDFVAIDRLLALANRHGVRVIFPFVDQWAWWGGIADYAAFRGKGADAFWTDPQIKADFQETIAHVVLRKNTVTGAFYRDDPAILAWETGNELAAPAAWTAEMAAFIKSLDASHLVIDGHYGIAPESLDDANIDIVSDHFYAWQYPSYAAGCDADRALSMGKRPFIAGEFGIHDTGVLAGLMDAAVDNGTSGALLWSLRSHDVNGGFFWHTEYEQGGVTYRSYHFPGFSSGAAYDEQNVIDLVREHAHAIRGLPVPLLDPPGPPALLSVDPPDAIEWRGAAGASSYVLERAESAAGPFAVVASGFDDAAVPDEARVADPSAQPGTAYYYRLRAQNEGGISEPSAVMGPVTLSDAVVVTDDLNDFSQVASHTANLGFDGTNAEYVGGDASRLARSSPTAESFTYEFGKPITKFSMDAYFWPLEDVHDMRFFTSPGGAFTELAADRQDLGGDWIHVVYGSDSLPAGTVALRVDFTNLTGNAWSPQVGRAVIAHEP